jgi:hypothetical protein
MGTFKQDYEYVAGGVTWMNAMAAMVSRQNVPRALTTTTLPIRIRMLAPIHVVNQ